MFISLSSKKNAFLCAISFFLDNKLVETSTVITIMVPIKIIIILFTFFAFQQVSGDSPQ